MKKQIFAALAALALTFAAQQGADASDAAPVTVDNYGRRRRSAFWRSGRTARSSS